MVERQPVTTVIYKKNNQMAWIVKGQPAADKQKIHTAAYLCWIIYMILSEVDF